MRADQKALAPDERMPSELHIDRHRAEIEVRPCEGVEDFSRGPFDVALDLVVKSVVEVACDAAVRCGHAGVVIGVVVPRSRADTRAKPTLVIEVEFAQQIEAIRDNSVLAELRVRFVIGIARQDARVLLLHAHADVVPDCVVPAELQVWIGGIDLRGVTHTAPQRKRHRDRMQPEVGDPLLFVPISHLLSPSSCRLTMIDTEASSAPPTDSKLVAQILHCDGNSRYRI